MRIRPYIPNKDYEYVSKWIDGERTHAFWCANLFPYPVTPESFHDFLEKISTKWTDSAFVATENNGQAVGFFCYSVNPEDNIGFLKFVIIDKTKRGKGYGKEMLNLALQYAFQITGAEAVQLNVFHENTLAKQCYEKVGFVERNIDKDVFSYKDELWSRCNMIVSRQSFCSNPPINKIGGNSMNFLSITSSDDMWKEVSQFAQNCSWRAGKSLSQNMSDNTFTDWERVIVALHENDIAGYCTVAKSDCIPNVSYTPYIGYMFVDEKYRGQRLSQKLISYAMSYLQALGFQQVFLVSDHENFYEKYGFKVIDRKMAPWGEIEKIYMREI